MPCSVDGVVYEQSSEDVWFRYEDGAERTKDKDEGPMSMVWIPA